MKSLIKRHDSAQEFYIDEGCFIIELSNSDDDPQVSVAQARVEPGVTTRWHRLKDITERYYIISGAGRVEVGDEPAQNVQAGDMVLIPPLCKQRITNTGTDDLIFLAICSPRFTPLSYQDLEHTAKQ